MSPTYMTFEDLKKALEESGRGYNMENITAAYNLANEAHADQKRRSGEPYISHPLNVAKLLVELGMDSESVEAGLLHDVVEDTSVDLSTIESKFGPGVMRLVDGVTKLTKMQFSSVEEQRAESIRKMLLAMSQDVRVMIIKLCDRLHNMRTGDAWPRSGGIRPWRPWRSTPPSPTGWASAISRRNWKTGACSSWTRWAMPRSAACWTRKTARSF